MDPIPAKSKSTIEKAVSRNKSDTAKRSTNAAVAGEAPLSYVKQRVADQQRMVELQHFKMLRSMTNDEQERALGWSIVQTRQPNVFAKTRHRDNNGFHGVTVHFLANVDPLDLVPILTNIITFPSWDWSIEKTKIIEQLSPNSCVVYCLYKQGSKAVAQRDYVYLMQWESNVNEVNVVFESVTHPGAPTLQHVVRGEIASGLWRVARQESAGPHTSLMSFRLVYNARGFEDAVTCDKVNQVVAIQLANNLLKLEKLATQQKFIATARQKYSTEVPLSATSSLPAQHDPMRRASHDVQHFVGDGAAAVATSVDIIGAAEKPLSPTATIADDVAARPRSRSISDGRTRFEIRRLTTDE